MLTGNCFGAILHFLIEDDDDLARPAGHALQRTAYPAFFWA